MKITAHTIVKNEVRFLWYSVMSVINYVDEMLLWDTGSTDGTIEIIKELKKQYPEKIKVKFFDSVDKNTFTDLRNKMLAETKSDWFIIVDGDEIWWKESIKFLTDLIRNDGDKYDSFVTKYHNMSGDLYHIQSEKLGKYKIDNKIGHITIRAVNNKIDGLYFGKPHGLQGLFDSNDVLIQERDANKRLHIDKVAYLHATNIQRSINKNEEKKVLKRSKKFKFDLGIKLSKDFYYPESFFGNKPNIVPDVWAKRNISYEFVARIKFPLSKIKGFIFKNKVGY